MTRSVLLLLFLLLFPALTHAQIGGVEAITVQDGEDGQTYSVTLQVLLLMTLLTLLPAAVLMMTAFTRIVIVLGILRQAIGTAQTPSNQVIIGLAFFLTLFVMTPVLEDVYTNAVDPYLSEEMAPEEALEAAQEPFREFMASQTRDEDLALFLRISDNQGVESIEDVPFTVLVPAFMTSELKTAFQIGFILYLPFLVVDLVVSSTLMSMGMLMLSPMIISLPFKIMLFVLVDGWSLVMGTLAASFF
ncbi:flagellar type III secretion system pore protein FliP [Aquisalimonas sp. 2447]|uniref:flagellar type III secretion system pore protein FliP n=1 Tax=Aquisalimonas sp. 2447 TaxID=2740807 RepID=UPI0014324357|nr:flagellar type III secretion system pore protein FliP [Aquisalimonas sp. 2447]QIT55694.1 flagellar type III secretion system pore protein FliP [Aquisalimonas sp. 2447]